MDGLDQGDAALAQQIKSDYRCAKLDARTRALLDFAVRMTREPEKSSPEALVVLRDAGWAIRRSTTLCT